MSNALRNTFPWIDTTDWNISTHSLRKLNKAITLKFFPGSKLLFSVNHQGLVWSSRRHLLPAGGQVATPGGGHQAQATLHHCWAAQVRIYYWENIAHYYYYYYHYYYSTRLMPGLEEFQSLRLRTTSESERETQAPARGEYWQAIVQSPNQIQTLVLIIYPLKNNNQSLGTKNGYSPVQQSRCIFVIWIMELMSV